MSRPGGAQTLPKRLRQLKTDLIRELPSFPNNRETKGGLEEKSLQNVLVDYLSWRSRLIGTRPRTVFGAELVTEQLVDQSLSEGAASFLQAIEKGIDVSSHLSEAAQKRGYTPQSGRDAEYRWEDKDMALNSLGVYHFHIGQGRTASGLITRSDELIFAFVGREEFHILGVFKHEVFDRGNEYAKLLRALYGTNDHESELVPVRFDPGLGGAGIANSGHSVAIRFEVAKIVTLLHRYERLLDSRAGMKQLGFDAPRPKPYWQFDHMDLVLADRASKKYGIVREGLN